MSAPAGTRSRWFSPAGGPVSPPLGPATLRDLFYPLQVPYPGAGGAAGMRPYRGKSGSYGQPETAIL